MKPTPSERDNLVKALVAARLGAGVSASAVAHRAELNRSTISRFEDGEQTIGAQRLPDVLRSYAALCGLNQDELLIAWNIMPPDAMKKIKTNPQLLALVRAA